jgi:nucleotide-binding universal stress UspA family protein
MRVVLSADLSDEGRAACQWCATNLPPGTTVIAVLGMNPVGELMFGVPPFDLTAAEHDLRIGLERDCCQPLTTAGLRAEGRFHPTSQARAITEVAVRERADLIVVGKRPHGWLIDAVRGETAGQVVHHPPCPVVVVPTRVDAGVAATSGSGDTADSGLA